MKLSLDQLLVTTERLTLSIPGADDAEAIVRYYAENRARFDHLDPPRPEGFFTVDYWRERAVLNQRQAEDGHNLRWIFRLRDDPTGPIVGMIAVTNVIRGPLQNAFVGFSVDAPWEGKGMLSEALRAVVDFAFGTLKLHRLEAGHLPTNTRSSRVLDRAGFEPVGYCKRYLFLGGQWQDSVQRARLAPTDDPPFNG